MWCGEQSWTLRQAQSQLTRKIGLTAHPWYGLSVSPYAQVMLVDTSSPSLVMFRRSPIDVNRRLLGR